MSYANRRSLAVVLFCVTMGWSAEQVADFRWFNVSDYGVEGRGWSNVADYYDRLPAHAQGVVLGPVWVLSKDSAGMAFRFVTDSGSIAARWTVRRDRQAMRHMPASGVSGLDLYVRDSGSWRFVALGLPTNLPSPTTEAVLIKDVARSQREYLLYLPLYNGVRSLEIGVAPGALFEKAAPYPAGSKPIVFYGTSITQGGCASRPGMAYPAILGRLLGRPTINLGFSGNGKSEPEMAHLLAELDAGAYVLDSLPNLDPAQVAERVGPFATILRKAHPATPIVLVENIVYPTAFFLEERRKRYKESNAALAVIYAKLRNAGDRHVYYVKAEDLLGGDGEATVDGVHPTDLGFVRMAHILEPVLRSALKMQPRP